MILLFIEKERNRNIIIHIEVVLWKRGGTEHVIHNLAGRQQRKKNGIPPATI
jgi:hypothetical protein